MISAYTWVVLLWNGVTHFLNRKALVTQSRTRMKQRQVESLLPSQVADSAVTCDHGQNKGQRMAV